ncbi:MAG TPA: HAD family acid phosphatase [Jatrophihabitans sp.]|jgi:phosphoglycolate phosphatase-like HAD superfamily hydrolase|uniref:HAD family acid phosphatase n=1 Tax=Jatrophihabitans sp. TaxID=1932789 RepID=UPI002DF89F38|nr:HAD family acid phosphatase [Jatrophihabitans sp.]
MTHLLAKVRAVPAALLAMITTLGLVAFAGSATADRGGRPVPAPPASPTSADQIQNIDQVRTAIKAYYGDTVTTTPDPVDGTRTLHTFSPTGAYANEIAGVERTASKYLAHQVTKQHVSGRKAIVLDIDDTSLNTFNYEIYSNFAYNPTTNAAFVNSASFPAVPGMPQLATTAQGEGYTVFFLTGRPVSQTSGTVTNLANAGFPAVPADHLFLKDLTNPIYSSCAPTCTTIQYKSLTRAYIESQGYNIVANFGDQYSDLIGGHADRTFKLPNPMYYLP